MNSFVAKMLITRCRLVATLAVATISLTLPSLAWGAPGGSTGVERAGSTTLDFLQTTLGPIVVGLGLVIAAFALVFGSRDGILKAVWVVVGGVILFAATSIVKFIQTAAS